MAFPFLAAAVLGSGLFSALSGRSKQKEQDRREREAWEARQREMAEASRDPRREMSNVIRLALLKNFGLDKLLPEATIRSIQSPGYAPIPFPGGARSSSPGLGFDLAGLVLNALGSLPGRSGMSGGGWTTTGTGNRVWVPPNNLLTPTPLQPRHGF
jgi:hypothetical protein